MNWGWPRVFCSHLRHTGVPFRAAHFSAEPERTPVHLVDPTLAKEVAGSRDSQTDACDAGVTHHLADLRRAGTYERPAVFIQGAQSAGIR